MHITVDTKLFGLITRSHETITSFPCDIDPLRTALTTDPEALTQGVFIRQTDQTIPQRIFQYFVTPEPRVNTVRWGFFNQVRVTVLP